jgi:hypothetical protein
MSFKPNGALVIPQGAIVAALADPSTTPMQKHKAVNEPLFTRSPCKDDVVQGQIGDCYLLAAINAVLSRAEGADLIQSMFLDSGNGEVVIRLYKAGNFHYLRVRKTLVHEYESKTLGIRHGTGNILHGQGALWVSLLEKAYTAFMRAPAGGGLATYKHVEGGAGMDAMAAIVGGGVGVSTGSALADIQVIRDALFALTEELSSGSALLNRIPALRDKAINAVANSVFAGVDGSDDHAKNWFQWNTQVNQVEFRTFFSSGPTLAKFRVLMKRIDTGLDPATARLVMVWVERYASELWPGEIGSGVYTNEQLNLFMKIQRMLATQRGVTAGTPEKLRGVVSGTGKSAGEAKVDGLAAKHEYTVLDTKMDPLGRRFILVRNPWGEYGRDYQALPRSTGDRGPATLKPVANEEKAESWIELTDFTGSFSGINVGPPVHSDNRRAFMSELQSRLAKVQAGDTGLQRRVDL